MSTAALKPIPGGREPVRGSEAEFDLDTWHAERLGIVRRRSPTKIHFEPISQPWLRDTVKRWAKFRLGTGASFGTICSEAQAMGWFSRFLTEQHPEVGGGAALTRSLLEHYLSWLALATLGESTRRGYLGFLHNFLESCRRHGWLAGLPADANIYFDELLRRPRPAPRFIDEFIMAQLEDPTNLAKLPDATTRHLVVLLIETGLRSSDALNLPFNPMLNDSAGWPCLRYFNAKIAEDQLVPLSPAGPRPSVPSRLTCATGHRTVTRCGCSLGREAIRPRPGRSATTPSATVSRPGSTPSVCVTRPAHRCTSPRISSATRWEPE